MPRSPIRSRSRGRRHRSASVDSLGRERQHSEDSRRDNSRGRGPRSPSRSPSRSASESPSRSRSPTPPPRRRERSPPRHAERGRRDSYRVHERRRSPSPPTRRRSPSRSRSSRRRRSSRSNSRSRMPPRRDDRRDDFRPRREPPAFGNGHNRGRYSNAGPDDFFEQRKRDRDAIKFSIWAAIPSPPPPVKKEPKMKVKEEPHATPPPAAPSSRRAQHASDDSASDSDKDSDSDSDSDDNRQKRKRKASGKSSRKKSSRKSSSRHRKSRSKSSKHKTEKSSSRKKKSRRRDVSSSDDSQSGDESDASSMRSAPSQVASFTPPTKAATDLEDLDAADRVEAEQFKHAVQSGRGTADSDDDDEIGPKPLMETDGSANAGLNYGKALRPGEGAAIAQYVQKNMRIPRRGEVGWNGPEIENLEDLGYVMSGSRHQRMNAVRIRKENQVYTAEEKRALALINFEEKQQRETRIMGEFREMLTERLTKKHGARLVEDMESSAKQQQQ